MKQMSYVSNPIIYIYIYIYFFFLNQGFFLTISGGEGFKPRFSTQREARNATELQYS